MRGDREGRRSRSRSRSRSRCRGSRGCRADRPGGTIVRNERYRLGCDIVRVGLVLILIHMASELGRQNQHNPPSVPAHRCPSTVRDGCETDARPSRLWRTGEFNQPDLVTLFVRHPPAMP